ncbi:ORF39 [Agrotis segetum granulovirus]|uniref:ORF39 n=1 Tax=Agrotis segetum granulosis virus TaxID=10464 RepID=Q6QXF8_GVAS|nr:ORF39 [Agrotis segetum granulovirus]
MSSNIYITFTIIVVKIFHSMLGSIIGIPKMGLHTKLSKRIHDGNESLLVTRVEIITSVIKFIVTLLFIVTNKEENQLKYKIRLVLLPVCGSVLTLITLLYMDSYQDTITTSWIYFLSILPSLTGESFLLETCLSDVVALIEKCPKRRVTLYLWVKGGKMIGVCLIQVVAPLVGITEFYMINMVSPFVCVVLVMTTFMAICLETKPAPSPEEIDLTAPKPLNTTAQRPSLYNTLREMTKYHYLLCLLITLHSAQRGEYKFTFIFLSSHLDFAPKELRLINGAQYTLFAVSLYVMGFIIKSVKLPAVTMIAFIISMLFSTAARVCQIIAWDLNRFNVWCLSALLSTPGPLAYQIMQQLMYQKFEEKRLVGFVLLTADQFVSIPFVQLYQTVAQLYVTPFYVTLGLMIAVTIGGLSFKTMRNWLR